MPKQLDPAVEHIRLMETRIAQQTKLVEKLTESGEDTAAANQRLELLKSALEEMRIQLGQLAPTELDAKRSDVAAALRTLSGSRKPG